MTTTPEAGAAVTPKPPRQGLPRDPRERLKALFDPGTLDLLPAAGKGEGEVRKLSVEERSGVVAGSGWSTARARWRSPPTRGGRAAPAAPRAAPRSSARTPRRSPAGCRPWASGT